MIVTKKALPRRTVLRGIGSALALPLLDAMVPALSALNKTPARPVHRLGFFYVANGANMDAWKPKGGARDFELSPSLAPLTPFRNQLVVLSGLAHRQAESMGDGNGEHTRGSAVWLNGVHPKWTEGADVRAGTTADQIAARELGGQTPLRSLELSLEPNFLVGNCDNGYSCVYMNTISWRTPTTPLPMENDPRLVFERLFGDGGTGEQRLASMRRTRSLLDSVTRGMAALQRQLGPADRGTVSEYFDAIREVEQRIQRAEAQVEGTPMPQTLERPVGIPDAYDDHARLMLDLLALAYRADITRVSTFMLCREVSSRTYPQIGVADQHHGVSHHQGSPDKLAKYAKINAYHVGLFAHFLEKIRSASDGDGNVLDHSMFLYGGGISDGDLHSHRDLPLVLAGGGSGRMTGGRFLSYPETPMANLLMTLLDNAGVRTDRLGDSSGRLELPGTLDL
jgi:hypothetical protein